MQPPLYSQEYNYGSIAGGKAGKRNGKRAGKREGLRAVKQDAADLAICASTHEFIKGYEVNYAYCYITAWRKAFDEALQNALGWNSTDEGNRR